MKHPLKNVRNSKHKKKSKIVQKKNNTHLLETKNSRTFATHFRKFMANHKSALKRIRANEKRRVRNRYQHKTTRSLIKGIRKSTSASEAAGSLKETFSAIDKLAKNNIIHKNKASNLKGKLQRFVNKLAS